MTAIPFIRYDKGMFPKFGPFDSYSIMILIGIVMCFVYLEIYYRARKLDRFLLSAIEINGVIAIIVGVVFSVLFQNLYDFIENPSAYSWTWAMTFYGGLIGGVLSFLGGYFLFIKKKFGPQMKDLLVIAPASITIAHGIGRIGCFLAGCCYGKLTDSWLGVDFPGIGKRYPTNLFEAIFLILLSVALLLLAIKKNFQYNTPIYLISYGVWRFLIEYLRDDHRGDFVMGLTPSQFWSIVMVFAGIAYIFLYRHLVKKKASKAISETKA